MEQQGGGGGSEAIGTNALRCRGWRPFDNSVALADVQRVAADFKHSAGYFAEEADA